MKRLLESFPVVIEFPIAWGDMDAFRHVNNVMYFRYFESARIAYFEKLQYMEMMDKTGIGPILASTQCRYRLPLIYPDTVSVGAKISDLQEDRFMMKYAVVSHRHQKMAAEGNGLIVSFDYGQNMKAPLQGELRRKIMEIENRGR